MKITKLLSALFLFLLVFSQVGFASDGVLILEKGRLKVIQQGVESIHRFQGTKIPVYAGDEIHTDADTQATLSMRNNTEKMQIYSNTFFKVEKMEPRRSFLSLWIGKAKFSVKSMMNKVSGRSAREFNVRTVSATIGIKGTEFVVGSTKTGTNLLTLEGKVSFASKAAPHIQVEVGKNQASRVVRNKPPTAPVEVSDTLKNQIIQSDSPEKWSEKDFKEAPKNDEMDKRSNEPADKTSDTQESISEEDVVEEEPVLEEVLESVDELEEVTTEIESSIDAAQEASTLDKEVNLHFQFQ